MKFKQGNTYKLYCIIDNIDIDEVQKAVFKFNTIKKIYLSDGTGDVIYEDDKFIINLTQKETLGLTDVEVKYEVAVKFNDNQVRKSEVYYTNSLETIIKEEI